MVYPPARTSWKGRSKKDYNVACQEEYASPALIKVTQLDNASGKPSARCVRGHMQLPSIASQLKREEKKAHRKPSEQQTIV